MSRHKAEEPLVNIYDAKTHLSRLVERAEQGAEVLIARGGRPVARLSGIAPVTRRIRFGAMKGKIRIGADFDAPLPAQVLAHFEGR